MDSKSKLRRSRGFGGVVEQKQADTHRQIYWQGDVSVDTPILFHRNLIIDVLCTSNLACNHCGTMFARCLSDVQRLHSLLQACMKILHFDNRALLSRTDLSNPS